MTARRGFFWVRVEPSTTPYGTVARGPLFVQWEAPVDTARPYPVVLIHGGGGQGTDWLGTPDGRPGWATYLLESGYAVYVVDRPGHGRSPFHPDVLGPMGGQFTYYINGVDDRVKGAVAIAVAGDWRHIVSYEGAWLYHGLYYYTRDGLRSGIDDLNTVSDVCRDPTMEPSPAMVTPRRPAGAPPARKAAMS